MTQFVFCEQKKCMKKQKISNDFKLENKINVKKLYFESLPIRGANCEAVILVVVIGVKCNG